MRLSLGFQRQWDAAALARHLQDLTIIYRWETADEIVEDLMGEQASPAAILDRFLRGDDLFFVIEHHSYHDLTLQKLQYGSPTSELFEGTVRGLQGIAGLIEGLIFFRNTRRLKELEVEKMQIELINHKIDTIERVHNILKKVGHSDEKIKELISRYGGSIIGLNSLIETGHLTKYEAELFPNEVTSSGSKNSNATDRPN